MPTRREDIVRAARGWIGTRFRHQGRVKRSARHRGGCDCLGLLVGVARELDLRSPCSLGPLAAYDSREYGHHPDTAQLLGTLDAYLFRHMSMAEMQPGDIAVFLIDGAPQHLGIVSDYPGGGSGMIHAFAPARAVVEHRLDASWQARLHRVYTI